MQQQSDFEAKIPDNIRSRETFSSTALQPPPAYPTPNSVPPRPPKPSPTRQTHNDPSFQPAHIPVSTQQVKPTHDRPFIDIYRTMDGDEVEAGLMIGPPPTYPDSEPPRWRNTAEGNVFLGMGDSSTSSSSSTVKREQRGKVQIEVLAPHYAGDYERSPNYQCSTVKVALDSKYSGDYERNPTYMSQLAAQQAQFLPVSQLPKRIPRPDEIADMESGPRTDKYRGEYERCDTYVYPPCSSSNRGEGQAEGRGAIMDSKYRGNYERNPIYMENLLKAAEPASHQYTTLQQTTREVPQQYATLTQDQSISSSSEDQHFPPKLFEDQLLCNSPTLAESTHLPPHSKSTKTSPSQLESAVRTEPHEQ